MRPRYSIDKISAYVAFLSTVDILQLLCSHESHEVVPTDTKMSKWYLLPSDLLEHQIAQVDLLLAMYPEDEIIIGSHSRSLLDVLRNTVETQLRSHQNQYGSSTIDLLLTLTTAQDRTLQLELSVPISYSDDVVPDEAPSTKMRIRQPSWLSRASMMQLNAEILDQEDLFSKIGSVQEAVTDHLQSLGSPNQRDNTVVAVPKILVRAWFYFPSISTRAKRLDIITHAPSYSLTGFLFAGKPGLLCLEGTSTDIDAYMKFIKTESWGDIPSHHKKVSERFREEGEERGGIQRVFPNMREITDEVGERRGVRANRGDMGAVEDWLSERGLGSVLARVLM